MMSLINYRLRITLNDSRQIVGQLLAFDAHMNLILADSQEYRKIKSRKAKARAAAAAKTGKADAEDLEEDDDAGASSAPDAVLEQKRTLGLLILRGENIVSMAIEAPPPADDRKQPTVSVTTYSDLQQSTMPTHLLTVTWCPCNGFLLYCRPFTNALLLALTTSFSFNFRFTDATWSR